MTGANVIIPKYAGQKAAVRIVVESKEEVSALRRSACGLGVCIRPRVLWETMIAGNSSPVMTASSRGHKG